MLAVTSAVACEQDDQRDEAKTYRPESPGIGASSWPALPCLPASSPRLNDLAACGAQGVRVLEGPTQGENAQGETVCRYRIAYTIPAGEACEYGRPLVDALGDFRTAPLVAALGWAGVLGGSAPRAARRSRGGATPRPLPAGEGRQRIAARIAEAWGGEASTQQVYIPGMSSSLPAVSTHQRMLSGILTALALTAVSGCRESHEKHASYTPGAQRGQAAVEGKSWPELPCLPRTDPLLVELDHDSGADDYEVIAGPNPVAEGGGTRCHYRITYTTEPGRECIVGRPLVGSDGAPRTAALVANAAWSAS